MIITNREIRRYSLDCSKKGKLLKAREKDFSKNKIILKKLCYNLEASLDKSGYSTVNTTYCIQPVEADVDIRYVLGILNSKLLSYYSRSVYVKTALRGGYIELRVYQVETLPVKRIQLKDQALIIQLVDKILTLNNELELIEKNSEKWNSIKSEIEKTDNKIDESVYRLYGLNQEDIKEIEANLGKI